MGSGTDSLTTTVSIKHSVGLLWSGILHSTSVCEISNALFILQLAIDILVTRTLDEAHSLHEMAILHNTVSLDRQVVSPTMASQLPHS